MTKSLNEHPDEAHRQSAGRGNSGESPARARVPKVQGGLASRVKKAQQQNRRISQAKGKSANTVN